MIKCTSAKPGESSYIQFACDHCGGTFGHFSDAEVRIGPDGQVRVLHVRPLCDGIDAFPEAVDSVPFDVFLAMVTYLHVLDIRSAMSKAQKMGRLRP